MENNQFNYEDSTSTLSRATRRVIGAVSITGLLVFGGAKLYDKLDGGTVGEDRIDVVVQDGDTITRIVEANTDNNGCDIREIVHVVVEENDGNSSLQTGQKISVPTECNG